MKKFHASSLCLFMMLLMTSILFGQPGNIYTNFTGSWADGPAMTDRGVTRATTIQSTFTGTGAFLYNQAIGDWSIKWCGLTTNYTRSLNSMITGLAFYSVGSIFWNHDMECQLQTNYYYTMVIGKVAANNNDMSILETSYNPINISSVTQSPASNVSSSESMTVTVTLSGTKNANEHIYVRYTTDNWATSSFSTEITSFVSNQGTTTIPAQAAGTTVSYYALSTIDDTPNGSDIDYLTLRLNNNNNANYSYKVSDIIWCNTQWPQSGTISLGGAYNVYAQVYADGITVGAGQGAGIQAWIGYSTTNSNPNTWTNWVPATYYTDNGNNDEYVANIGPAPAGPGTYYYASRFQLGNGAYVYGGYNSGLWDGTTNVSGVMTISDLSWCNLQSPASGTCAAGGTYMAYAQVYAPGLTDAAGQGTGIQSWIGYSTTNTDPSTWSNWVAATYIGDAGTGNNNDEYQANIGLPLSPGTYYYASRFQLGSGTYHYGGYNAGGGGFWDGLSNVSGILTVTAAPTVTLQTTSAPAGNVSVDISMTNFTNVGSLQWTINYNPAYLTFVSISDCNPVDICDPSNWNYSTPGEITTVWADYPGFVANGKIAQLNFTYTGAGCTDLTWGDNPTARLIADDTYQPYTGIT
ncbi:MAG TPA: cohesin domain-containing protein [Bacteroidales bacterium]|nr:cohesin domain-containing protein [Bacteroidales bacterium]HQN15766.1 cohesin domain-containing protein [Bacteroidales bacterium]HQP15208.1 cohesin domain-containing protein [Bacteroidales bacterium]